MVARRVHWIILAWLFACGCGDDGSATAPPDPSPTPTSVALPSPTPVPHVHILLGSHHSGGGEITAHFDFDHAAAELTERQCVGGAGEACDGGVFVYSGTSPAFASVSAGEAEEHLQPLVAGTMVELEVVAIDPGVQIQIGATQLDTVGSRAALGSAPFHMDVRWQLILPASVDPAASSHTVTLRLVAPQSPYEPSAPYTLRLVVLGSTNDHDHAS